VLVGDFNVLIGDYTLQAGIFLGDFNVLLNLFYFTTVFTGCFKVNILFSGFE